MCADHTMLGVPISQIPLNDIYDVLNDGACYADGDPEVPVSDEDWYWIKMRLEIELVRRNLGISVRV